MNRDELIELSPVRALDRGLRGGLGAGRLGVLMARAGAGKTAVLCHLAIDALLRRRPVLHVALGDGIEHVSAWYHTLLDDVLGRAALADADAVRTQALRDRVIKAFARKDLGAAELDEAIGVFERHMQFKPALIVIDGFDWESPGAAAALAGFKATAQRLGAELWMTAESHKVASGLAEPCVPHEAAIDVALRLEPRGADIALELVRVAGRGPLAHLRLELETDTLRLSAAPEPARTPREPLPPAAYTLLSGGAAGAEAEFGAAAERAGVAELTFTFPGRVAERTRGVYELTEDELAQGAVSSAYLQQQMRRTYPDTPIFRRVVQSIWHQVNTAGEVFAVGEIKPDGTVSGGTGWAVELARHWEKPVHVYDQAQRGWFLWRGGAWRPVDPPRITRTRFCGTGTRFLTDDGRAAIHALYAASFGAP
jgi:KaiC/GvpD/RAD55 family RecA-like ATPase